MNLNDFLTNVVGIVVANIPQFVVVMSYFSFYLKNVKKKTDSFPDELIQTKNSLLGEWDVAKTLLLSQWSDVSKQVFSQFESTRDQMMISFAEAKNEMFNAVKRHTEELTKGVKAEMESMSTELSQYRKMITSVRDQTNIMVLENKAFLEVFAALVCKDPEFVRDNVASVVATRINLTKQELERYPEVLMTNMTALENGLKEAMKNIGEQAFAEMLKRVGYEKNSDGETV